MLIKRSCSHAKDLISWRKNLLREMKQHKLVKTQLCVVNSIDHEGRMPDQYGQRSVCVSVCLGVYADFCAMN